MYKFLLRPGWIAFHLLVIGSIILMAWLGFWQLRRLNERDAFNETVIERSEQSPTDLSVVLTDPNFDPDTAEWVPVTASGTWLPEQVLVFNRFQNGVAGDNVLTPLLLDDGSIVLVNRGFIRLGTPAPDPPELEVEILGRIRPSQVRSSGELTDSVDGPLAEIRRIDIPRLAGQLPGEVAPVYIDLVASIPEIGPADPLPVPAPETDSGPHLSYAMQWFIFSICVAVGWVLAVRRSIATRRKAVESAAAAA
ncbi:MAG: SURF1 family protein [Ilumatobacteraceae bacterium]|nr:SURF1 family protein [Ilumatobacteraceae bacterium]